MAKHRTAHSEPLARIATDNRPPGRGSVWIDVPINVRVKMAVEIPAVAEAAAAAEAIIEVHCRVAGVDRETLLGPSREAAIVDVRRSAAKALWQELGMSTTQIGKLLNRNHASIQNLIHNRKAETRS